MNGPFELQEWGATILDASGQSIARGEGPDERAERENAEMLCDALNAVYYATKAAKRGTP